MITAAAVLLSGQIPALFFRGFIKREKFRGWNKIHKEKEIELAVNKYIEDRKDNAISQVPSTFDSTESLV